MRQRVVIALALAAEPRLIVADEPTTALDVSIQAQIIALLKRLCREHGAAVMLVTHDMGVIAETCDRVAVMYAGRIVEIGPVRDVIHAPRAPVHRRADGLDPGDGRGPRASAADRRRDAAPDRDPARLRVQPALPARVRALPRASGPTCCRPARRAPPAGCTRRRGRGRREPAGPPQGRMPECAARRHDRVERAGARPRTPAPPLVDVHDLAKMFDVSAPWLNRVIERKPRTLLHAVDGVSFAIAARRDARAGRRVGLRQEHGRADAGRPVRADAAVACASTAPTSRHARAPPRAPAAAPPHADDLPGPVREPEPALEGARHRRRAAARAPAGRSATTRCRGAGRAAAAVGRPRRGRRREVPAPVLRRPAPADLDRAGARDAAGVPGLRRADLGARRVGAGAGAEPDERPAARRTA